MSEAEAMEMLRIMPREMRLMTERIFSLTGLPKSFLPAIQDTVMYSQKLGLGGFALLEQRFERLKEADPARVSIREEEGERLILDGGGQHAWFVMPSLLDLIGELVGRFGMARISVVDVMDPTELRIATALGARVGLSISFTGAEAPHFTALQVPVIGELRRDEPLLWELFMNGSRIEAGLWWRIYHLAKKALTPDSVVSRRHAGPLIVNDDGTVIGRKDNDDDTDINFLTSPKSGELETGDALS
ncbi:hypothetical protein L598_006800000060 [Mesorhizobium sp. J18]|uniref:hypothetical protein n=1 Tax=Mesorhizobium sp. J18 TaxID=935263 RepID=UPI00119B1ACA|nr:hypothetical protein [Mesorhizobium sp. J18]TWG90512.1 hypothetical protein L598_006800000060 [Mesorhizobium sp. J18]